VRIADSFVFKEPVSDYSADFPFLWDEIVFPVRYGSDWRYALAMLEGMANEVVVGDCARESKDAWKDMVQKYKIENARIEPIAHMKADKNGIEFSIRHIVDYQARRATKNRLYARILEEIDWSDGKVRIASAGFELLSAPDLAVRLRRSSQ